MIAQPQTEVVAVAAPQWRVTKDNARLDARTEQDLDALLLRVRRHVTSGAASITIRHHPPQHLGLGSKTALLLAVAQAITKELDLNLTAAEIQRLSGRGGTSGIGINGFVLGGFLVDSGHKSVDVPNLGPSSSRIPYTPPPVTLRIPIPPNWRFHLLVPNGIQRAGAQEAEFFRRATPIPADEVFRCIALALHELAPAVQAADLTATRDALIKLHETGFKRREVQAQSSQVRNLINRLASKFSFPVGLSSLGPLVYLISDEEVGTECISQQARELGAKYFCASAGLNECAQVTL